MRADTVFAFREIAVHAEDLETGRIVIALEPEIEFQTAAAALILCSAQLRAVCGPTTVDMIDAQEFID